MIICLYIYYVYIYYVYIYYVYIYYVYIYISYVDMISPFLSKVLGATLSGRPLATR